MFGSLEYVLLKNIFGLIIYRFKNRTKIENHDIPSAIITFTMRKY